MDERRRDRRGVISAKAGRAPAAAPLPVARVHEAGDLVGRALADDSWAAVALPRAARRTRGALARLGLGIVQYGLRHGEVWATAGALDGVAIWLPPDGPSAAARRPARDVRLATSLGLTAGESWRFLRAWRSLETARRRGTPEPHWHLAALAVNPTRRGAGVEEMVLAPVLARADAAGQSCALVSLRARSVLTLTERGFVVVAEGPLPAVGVTCWTLRRSPAIRV